MRLSTCSLVLQRSTLFRLSIWVLLKPLQAFEDLPLCLQLLGTAGWVKAELSSSSQGYARLPASRCVPALVRGREAGALGRVQGFPRAGLEALA